MTVLFVGLACVRKGIHLLLKAWARAKLKGRLVLAGDIDSRGRQRCAEQLNRSDVMCVHSISADVAAIIVRRMCSCFRRSKRAARWSATRRWRAACPASFRPWGRARSFATAGKAGAEPYARGCLDRGAATPGRRSRTCASTRCERCAAAGGGLHVGTGGPAPSPAIAAKCWAPGDRAVPVRLPVSNHA